ncbi:MAG: DUF1835 domain-containing protein [Gemmatimonadales bacterium]
MQSTLHVTNGDSAAGGIQASGLSGEILSWRDVLHEGPVPAGLSLDGLSRVRAAYLAAEGMGDPATLERDLAERDNMLRRFSDFDEVILWFDWDLYDQLQVLQILDFLADFSRKDLEETGTRLSIVCIDGYLGTLAPDAFPQLNESRTEVSEEMLALARRAWTAFRSDDPRELERVARGDTSALKFLAGALERELEELPSVFNGLSRSESQVLEAIAHGPLSFNEVFKRCAIREERIFCGDVVMARYIERMSRKRTPLLAYPSGDAIDAPRTEEDSRAFRNAEMALTTAGREVLSGDKDWIEMGGSDRWLGGVHLDGEAARWRWDSEARQVIESGPKEPS